MLPSINGSLPSGGTDDRTAFVSRVDSDVDRTTLVPQVPTPNRVRAVLPWVGFGVVAVIVVAATTTWASALRGPDDAAAPVNAAIPPVVVSRSPLLPSPVVTAGPADEATTAVAVRRKRTAAPARPTVPLAPAPTAAPAASSAPAASPTSSTKPTKKPVSGQPSADPVSGFAPTARNATPLPDGRGP